MRRRRGPINISDDEEVCSLKQSPALRQILAEDKVVLKDKPIRCSERPRCTEHDHSLTGCACDDLLTLTLISKCLRGVCEL